MHKRSLESLSDVELHKKVMEYGLPSVGITEITRPLLIKKLKTHIQSSRRSERSSSKISTTAAQQHLTANEISNSNSNSYGNISSATNARNNKSDSPRPYHSLIAKELQSSTYNVPLTERANSSLSTNVHRECVTLRNSGTGDNNSYNNLTPRTYLNNLNSSTNLYKRYAPSSSDSEDDALYGNAALPHRQHFGVVGRLLNLRDSTLQYKKNPLATQQQQHEHMDYIANKRIYSQIKPTYNTFNQTLYQRIKAFSRSWRGFKQLHIPHAIIFVFVLFLIVIASVYLIKHPDITNLIRESNTQFTLCTKTATGTQQKQSVMKAEKPLQNCLEQQQLANAVAYNRQLIQLVHKQAVEHYCVNSSLPYAVSTQEFIRHLVSLGNVWDMRQVLRDFQASVYLIKQNPQWNLAILNEKGATITDTTQLLSYVANGDTKFMLLKPNLPITCVLYNKLQRFFIIIGVGALVMSICLIFYLAFRHIKQIQQEKQAAIGNLCTEIVNEVLYQATANENEPNDVVLNHLRDKLIPMNKRKRELSLWNEALRLLEAYESRIQFVIVKRNGELVRCARWTGNLMPESRDLSFRKQWQSPAFDNGNRICSPPTPCLKIRHMFDSTEVKHPNLKKVIEEAIFEKVGSRCNIMDIQLDLQTCCVYVRCASEEDAGIVHNEINGWWFDKRLVSIKFLRLQRYLARFPESKT